MKSELLPIEKVRTSRIDYEFVSVIISRFLKILFRSNKKIKMVSVKSTVYDSLGEDFIRLNYRFKNGVYYRINGQLTEKCCVILNKNEIFSGVDVVVYGVFTQKKFTFNITA